MPAHLSAREITLLRTDPPARKANPPGNPPALPSSDETRTRPILGRQRRLVSSGLRWAEHTGHTTEQVIRILRKADREHAAE